MRIKIKIKKIIQELMFREEISSLKIGMQKEPMIASERVFREFSERLSLVRFLSLEIELGRDSIWLLERFSSWKFSREAKGSDDINWWKYQTNKIRKQKPKVDSKIKFSNSHQIFALAKSQNHFCWDWGEQAHSSALKISKE